MKPNKIKIVLGFAKNAQPNILFFVSLRGECFLAVAIWFFYSFTTSKIRLPRRRFTPPRNDTLTAKTVSTFSHDSHALLPAMLKLLNRLSEKNHHTKDLHHKNIQALKGK
jgi:hypothetical protein